MLGSFLLMKGQKMSLQDIVFQIRRDIVRMVHAVQSGHPGGSLGCTEFLTVLYNEIMQMDKKNFDRSAKNQDVFILSNGHISPVLYSTLARSGYFDVKELSTFRKINSRLQGHPSTHDKLPGVHVASGSLGQGMSVAIGIAEAKKLNNDKNIIYTLHGDGEMQEGQIWESLMYAAAKKIDNLICTIDYNGQQIDGSTKDVLDLGDLEEKFKSFGWKVLTVENGNDLSEIREKLLISKSNVGNKQPIAILLKTQMGYGVDFMVGTHKWHGIPPNDEQLASALAQNKETLGDY